MCADQVNFSSHNWHQTHTPPTFLSPPTPILSPITCSMLKPAATTLPNDMLCTYAGRKKCLSGVPISYPLPIVCADSNPTTYMYPATGGCVWRINGCQSVTWYYYPYSLLPPPPSHYPFVCLRSTLRFCCLTRLISGFCSFDVPYLCPRLWTLPPVLCDIIIWRHWKVYTYWCMYSRNYNFCIPPVSQYVTGPLSSTCLRFDVSWWRRFNVGGWCGSVAFSQ